MEHPARQIKKPRSRSSMIPCQKKKENIFLNCTSKKEADKYLELSLIQQVNASPLKIQFLERWEKQAFKGLENSLHQLQQLNHVWIDAAYTARQELSYVDIGPGFLTWNSYNLILQFCREKEEIIIRGDISTLVQQQ